MQKFLQILKNFTKISDILTFVRIVKLKKGW